MLAVVDYGVGNLFSLTCSLRAIGADRGQLYILVAGQVLLLCAAGIPAGLLLGALSARGILTAATGLQDGLLLEG